MNRENHVLYNMYTSASELKRIKSLSFFVFFAVFRKSVLIICFVWKRISATLYIFFLNSYFQLGIFNINLGITKKILFSTYVSNFLFDFLLIYPLTFYHRFTVHKILLVYVWTRSVHLDKFKTYT